MAVETSIDYSKTFSCETCDNQGFSTKDGPGCLSCPAYENTHYFPRGEGFDDPDVLFMGDVPEVPAVALLKRNEGNKNFYHAAFTDDGGKVVRAAVDQLTADVPSETPGRYKRSIYGAYRVRYIYAVKCAVEKPNKDTITACQTPLGHELSKISAARRANGKLSTLVVVATGATTLRSLGIPVQKEEDALGRVYEVVFGQIPLVVVATMSLKAMAATGAGKYSSIISDVTRAFDIVRGQSVKQKPREEIEKGYIYPKTVQEVKELVDYVLAYSENGVDPEKWTVAFDTETNTLHPHRDGTKLLTVTVSWAEGKAASIPLWHKETPYDPELAWEHVKRLLASEKPKAGHNVAKYDQKVIWKYKFDINNLRWDCLLAEHALEEDKKGQYGLKYLVKQHLPELSGYEDKLHEYLDKEEGEDQGDSIRAQQAENEKDRPLPKPVQEALDRCELTPKFQAGTLEKLQLRAEERIRQVEFIRLVNEFLARHSIVPPFSGRAFKAALKKLRGSLLEPADKEIIEKLAEVEDFTFFEPVSEKDEQFIKDAALLLAAKRSGEFQKKAEKKTKEETDGGFENIPLDELNFYGAVDADATRRLAVNQIMRMRAEDHKIANKRKFIASDMRLGRNPDYRRYKLEILYPQADALVNLHRERYLPRARSLADMEFRGICIDKQYLRDSKIELDNVVARTEEQIYTMAGERFKIGSSAQLGKFLFDTGVGFIHPDPEAAQSLGLREDYADKIKFDGTRMMYRYISLTAKGAMQTNEKTLKTYVTNYKCPFSDLILLYKKAIKARDTFLKNIELLSGLDGRIHTNFNLNGTSTGRLSSSNINLQNIPKGTLGALVDKNKKLVLGPDGKPVAPGVKCKKLFIPDDPSYALINADAKGAEVSIFSAYSKDPGLIAALNDGLDAHCYFAAKTLRPEKIGYGLTGESRRLALAAAGIDDDHDWSYEDFFKGKDFLLEDKGYCKRLKELRDNIKRVVFGILFGAGARKIAEIAGIAESLAQTIIKALFDEFKSIPGFVEQTKWELRTFGFVETYHGRRRRFQWNPRTAPRKMLAKAERQAVNFKIQGTNSDIVMDVLCDVRNVLERDMHGRMLLTVHDSLVFQVPKRFVHQVKDMMFELGTRKVGKACPWLTVPYRWDIEMGESYGNLQSVEDYIKTLPESTFLEGPQGYTEEEMYEELRNVVWEREEGEAA